MSQLERQSTHFVKKGQNGTFHGAHFFRISKEKLKRSPLTLPFENLTIGTNKSDNLVDLWMYCQYKPNFKLNGNNQILFIQIASKQIGKSGFHHSEFNIPKKVSKIVNSNTQQSINVYLGNLKNFHSVGIRGNDRRIWRIDARHDAYYPMIAVDKETTVKMKIGDFDPGDSYNNNYMIGNMDKNPVFLDTPTVTVNDFLSLDESNVLVRNRYHFIKDSENIGKIPSNKYTRVNTLRLSNSFESYKKLRDSQIYQPFTMYFEIVPILLTKGSSNIVLLDSLAWGWGKPSGRESVRTIIPQTITPTNTFYQLLEYWNKIAKGDDPEPSVSEFGRCRFYVNDKFKIKNLTPFVMPSQFQTILYPLEFKRKIQR